MSLCHYAVVFPKEWLKHSDCRSKMRPLTVESSIYVLCFDVAPLMWCGSGIQKRIGFSDVFSRMATDIVVYRR